MGLVDRGKQNNKVGEVPIQRNSFVKKMWWQMVPTLGIIAAGLGIPLYANQYINMLQLNGKSVIRNYKSTEYGLGQDWVMYLRDERITGSPYIPRGLESIPD